MSKIWAITDTTTGVVVGVQHLSSSTYTDGGAYETGYVTRDISSVSDPDSYMTKYWANNQWNDKPDSTGRYYKWSGSAWVLDSTHLWADIRSKRDALLQECDWAVLPDSPLSDSDKTSVETYIIGESK